jgi:hypothetical protein
MLRIVLAVIAGFISWLIVWMAVEKIISALWPAFGVHQRAFEDAIKNGGQFTGETPMLLTHIVLGSILAAMAGCLAAFIAGDNSRAPLYVGILLLIMAIAKAAMSWQYVPIWYHIVFTAVLPPRAILGGKLVAA